MTAAIVPEGMTIAERDAAIYDEYLIGLNYRGEAIAYRWGIKKAFYRNVIKREQARRLAQKTKQRDFEMRNAGANGHNLRIVRK